MTCSSELVIVKHGLMNLTMKTQFKERIEKKYLNSKEKTNYLI